MDDPDRNRHDQQQPDSNWTFHSIHKLKLKLKLFKQRHQSPPPPPPPANRHQDGVFEDGGEIPDRDQFSRNTSEQENHAANSSDDHLIRVSCPICEKRFTNGKALGGHLRVHKPKPLPDPNSDPGTGLDPVACDICGKEFPSQKSLFGHMRAHPDREWRGMRGPGRIPKWGVKGKRGRINIRVGAEIQAAVDLMLLVNDGVRKRREERESLKKRIGEFDADELYFLQNLGVPSGSGYGDQANPRMEEDGGNVKRVRVRDSIEENNNENDGRMWDCNTCDRAFFSHQALGGHKSSCHKNNGQDYDYQTVEGTTIVSGDSDVDIW